MACLAQNFICGAQRQRHLPCLGLLRLRARAVRRGYEELGVRIAAERIVVPEHPDAEALAAGRARLEANAGASLPDEAWQAVVDEAMLQRPRWEKTREVIAEIVRRHGIDAPGLGRLALINLSVDC